MYAIQKNMTISIPQEWSQGYKKLGIEITHGDHEKNIWWEEKVLDYFQEYGVRSFSKLRIWDIEWPKKAQFWGHAKADMYRDPRGMIDRSIQTWLLLTQNTHQRRIINQIDRLIKKLFSY